jgi:hypothetical protein
VGGSLLQHLGPPAPQALAGPPGRLPALHTLSLSQQADLLLLVRAAPHKFAQQSVAALLAEQLATGLPGPRLGASLLQHLAESLQGGLDNLDFKQR